MKLNLGSGGDYREGWVNYERFLDSDHHVGETDTPDVQGDAHSLPFQNNAFNKIIAIHILEHLRCPIVCLEEVNRVLKSEGGFYMEVPDPQNIKGERDEHMYSWTEWSMYNIVRETGFEVMEYGRIHDPDYIDNGPAHYVRCKNA